MRSEDQGVGKPLPKTIAIKNVSVAPQGIGCATFQPGDVLDIDEAIALNLIRLPDFERADGAAVSRSIGQPNTQSSREITRAIWADPDVEPWVDRLNRQVFPCQTSEFDPVEKSDHKLSIVFRIMGLDQLHGGNRVILRLCGHLARRGHDVTISTRKSDIGYGKIGSTPVNVIQGMQDADYVVGTYWPTIVEVAEARLDGVKVGLTQSDEPSWVERGHRDRLPSERAFGFPGVNYVAISQQVADSCRERYSTNITHVLPGNGVDSMDFSPRLNHHDRRGQVCAIYRGTWFKGDPFVLQVMEQLKKCAPDVQMAMAGFKRFSHPSIDRFVLAPPVDEMALFYSQSDVYLSGSKIEGSPLPPLEAMACGCIPVVPRIGTEEYLVDGHNGFIIDADDSGGAVDRVRSILGDDSMRRTMMQNCIQTARDRPWPMVGEAFESILVDLKSRRRSW